MTSPPTSFQFQTCMLSRHRAWSSQWQSQTPPEIVVVLITVAIVVLSKAMCRRVPRGHEEDIRYLESSNPNAQQETLKSFPTLTCSTCSILTKVMISIVSKSALVQMRSRLRQSLDAFTCAMSVLKLLSGIPFPILTLGH